MKRFLLFTFANYYPEGGWYDFRNSYDSSEDALIAAPTVMRERADDHFQIVDTKTGSVTYG